jgi:heavy metal sensor kinase
MTKSLRLQLVLWSTLVNAVLLLSIEFGVWATLREVQNRQINDILRLTATQLAADVYVDSSGVSLDLTNTRLTLSQQGILAWFVNGAGQLESTIGLTSQLPIPVVTSNYQDIRIDQDRQIRVYYAEFPDCPMSNAATNAAINDGITKFLTVGATQMPAPAAPVQPQNVTGNCGAVIVGLPLEPLEQTSRTVLIILGVAILGALVFSTTGGLFLANRAFNPIADITAKAKRISHQNLSERLTVKPLPAEVGHLAQTFDDMLDRLQAAFEHEHQFTVDVSHELRTPLSLLKAQLSLALRRPRSVETLTSMMKEMETDVDRMTRLVDAMLTLMRTQSTHVDLMTLDLSEVLDGLVSQLQPLASAKQIQLGLQAPSHALTLGDRDSLVRLFLNLLDNALKYSTEGQIEVCVAPAGTEWQIDVSDTGIGIPPEDLPKLFTRFYRADSPQSREVNGVGLGLSIVQAIVYQHGGRLTVQSQPGHGTTFTVFLPRL